MPKPICVPSRDEFLALAKECDLVPVYREILADLETPVSAFLKIRSGNHAFLLESVEGGEKWGRYSFLGTEPAVVFTARGREVKIRRRDGSVEERTEDPLESLRSLVGRYRPAQIRGLPRFFGGAVGYVGYDAVRLFERLPERLPDDLGLPEMYLIVPDALLVFDRMAHTIKVIVNVVLDGGVDPAAAYDDATRRIEDVVRRLETGVAKPEHAALDAGPPVVGSNMQPREFEQIVERAREYIRAGDVIQVVLAQRFEMPLRVPPFDVYRQLRVLNPSPYMFFLQLGEYSIVGASPEVMARVEAGEVGVRPIAGTRPRGDDEARDRELERELRNDPKERAEHIMLLDLGRNDVGRVARVGSVRVTERMEVERYSHVMHLVSNVCGTLAPGRDCFDAFRATFPAGTLSGAPKVRAMEIIEELERVRRGVYGGAVGYFSFSGNMDMCIAIRTAVAVRDKLYVEAGAGIVADSDPHSEHVECVNKARAVVHAVETAERA